MLRPYLSSPQNLSGKVNIQKNVLDDLLNNDDLLDELQDKPAIVATVGIIPFLLHISSMSHIFPMDTPKTYLKGFIIKTFCTFQKPY